MYYIYIISLNLVQCGHCYTYSDICLYLSILYSLFSVILYAINIYIYIFIYIYILWSGDGDGHGQVQFHMLFWTKSVVCGCIYIYIFFFTILYPIYYVLYTIYIYIYIYMVGGFKHLLFSISFMGWYPSHWRTPSFFKLIKTTNQIYLENPACINQVLGRLVVKAWPWDHPSLLVWKSQRCSTCFSLERPSTGVYEPVFGSHMNFWKTSLLILQIDFPLCSPLCAINQGKL